MLRIVVASLLLAACVFPCFAQEDAQPIPRPALWDFLQTGFDCEGEVRSPEGEVVYRYTGTWKGEYVLDGKVMADTFRGFGPEGELIALGTNFRAWDPKAGRWQMKWIDAQTGLWTQLGLDDGVTSENGEIHFRGKGPEGRTFRVRFTDMSDDGFLWHGDLLQPDGSWHEDWQLIKARRKA